MSAFTVSKKHTAAVVRFFQMHAHERFDDTDLLDWANRLQRANVASVNYRYPHHEQERAEKITQYDLLHARLLTPVEALKAVQCLNYQSCEPPTWEESPERALLKRIEYVAINALPGYNEAPWDIH